MRLIDGYIPESEILNFYTGEYRPNFEEAYITTRPDALALIWRTDKELPKDSVEARGLGRIHVYYTATLESIAVSIRMIDACGEWWRWRTHIHLADTTGDEKVQKLIRLFSERIPPNSLRYGPGRWVHYYGS